ncbi:MAG: SDR family oxidoreductase [Catenulispora sp.]|nr:SDR family oxidoreductase [Catenulispora sp.]
MQLDLSGRTAIVTGAARGIGAAIAAAMAEAGARVVLADLEAPRTDGPHTLGVAADITDESSVHDLVRQAAEAFGGPHILVNNAGISLPAPTLQTPLDRWERVLRVNLTGAFVCAKACLPAMRDAGWGRIVTISSFAAKSAPIYGDNASYAASKAGLTGLIHNLAVEFAADGVTVNGIAPGIVDTELLRGAHSPERRAELAARLPVGRFATPEEVAALAVFLASPYAGSITGEIVNVNGGLYLD